jgi:coenzyme F420-reducing hydrogenase delta subunit
MRAERRVESLQRLLDDIGIGAERLEMVKMSAGMGERFAEVAERITEKIRALGPNPIRAARSAA